MAILVVFLYSIVIGAVMVAVPFVLMALAVGVIGSFWRALGGLFK